MSALDEKLAKLVLYETPKLDEYAGFDRGNAFQRCALIEEVHDHLMSSTSTFEPFGCLLTYLYAAIAVNGDIGVDDAEPTEEWRELRPMLRAKFAPNHPVWRYIVQEPL